MNPDERPINGSGVYNIQQKFEEMDMGDSDYSDDFYSDDFEGKQDDEGDRDDDEHAFNQTAIRQDGNGLQ